MADFLSCTAACRGPFGPRPAGAARSAIGAESNRPDRGCQDLNRIAERGIACACARATSGAIQSANPRLRNGADPAADTPCAVRSQPGTSERLDGPVPENPSQVPRHRAAFGQCRGAVMRHHGRALPVPGQHHRLHGRAPGRQFRRQAHTTRMPRNPPLDPGRSGPETLPMAVPRLSPA